MTRGMCKERGLLCSNRDIKGLPEITTHMWQDQKSIEYHWISIPILYDSLPLCVFLCLSVSLCLSMSLFLYLSLSFCLPVCMSLSVSVSLCVSLSLYVSLFLCLSVSLSVSVCLSLSVSVSVCLSIYLSPQPLSVAKINCQDSCPGPSGLGEM